MDERLFGTRALSSTPLQKGHLIAKCPFPQTPSPATACISSCPLQEGLRDDPPPAPQKGNSRTSQNPALPLARKGRQTLPVSRGRPWVLPGAKGVPSEVWPVRRPSREALTFSPVPPPLLVEQHFLQDPSFPPWCPGFSSFRRRRLLFPSPGRPATVILARAGSRASPSHLSLRGMLR